MKRLLLAAVAASMIVLPSKSASADAVPGLRFGLTDDPDAFFVGMQFQTLVSGGRTARIYFVPGFDVGVDDGPADFWMLRGTAHFEFHFPVSRDRRLALFPMIGLSINYLNFDTPAGDDDYFEPALDVGGGMKWDRFKFEIWGSLDDDDDFEPAPDLTIAFGVLF